MFELIRGRIGHRAGVPRPRRSASVAKLPSGYQRDLQLMKSPLFRGIDLASQTLAILPPAIEAMKFRAERIELDPAIHAAEEANALVVREGIPFREAYRRVAAKLNRKGLARVRAALQERLWRTPAAFPDARRCRTASDTALCRN